MASRFTAEEVADLLDNFGLSESDSDEEEDPGVSSYLGSGSVDVQQLQSLREVVDGGDSVSQPSQLAPCTVASALLDSTDEEEREEDFLGFLGKNKQKRCSWRVVGEKLAG